MTRIFQILTILTLIFILYMSFRPSVSTGGVEHADKVLHLLAYGFVAGLARLGWPREWGGWIVLFLVSIGVSIEIGQHIMALGRTGSIGDALANATGVLLAVIIFHFIRRRQTI